MIDAVANETIFVVVLYADCAEADMVAAARQRLAVVDGVHKIVSHVGPSAPGEVVLAATKRCIDLQQKKVNQHHITGCE